MLYFTANFIYNICRTAVIITRPLLFLKMGVSLASVGFFVAFFSLAVMLTRFLMGIISDRVGVKKILVSAFFLSGCIKIAYVTTPLSLAGILTFLDGITHGFFMSVRGPILYSISDTSNRGGSFGKMTAISNIAGFSASLAAGYLFDSINAQLFYIFLGVLLLVPALILHLFFAVPNAAAIKKNQFFNKEAFSHISGALIIVCLINFVQNIIMAPLWDCVMPLYITETLVMGAGVIGIVYSCDSLFSAGGALLLGKTADKKNPFALFVYCCILMAAFALILCLYKDTTPVMFALFIGIGIIFSAASPVLEKIESGAVSDRFTGFDYALISLSVGGGAAVGNFFAGAFMTSHIPIYWLYITAAGNAALILLTGLAKKHEKT